MNYDRLTYCIRLCETFHRSLVELNILLLIHVNLKGLEISSYYLYFVILLE